MSDKKENNSTTRLSIYWSDKAKADLTDIGDFIARDNSRAAIQWIEKLMFAVEQAADMPFSGRIVPEFQRSELREIIRGNYRIVYRIGDNRIDVLTVFEGHRRFPNTSIPSGK